MKIAIVMTFFERQTQLERTLLSIETQTMDLTDDLLVIIVDDASPTPVVLPSITNYPVYLHRITSKSWTNPEPAYNTGIAIALRNKADVIIVQNAECMHVGDVINHATSVRDNTYITFGCFSLNEHTTRELDFIDLEQLINENAKGACADGQNAWYNHPKYRPVGYDFCAAMTRKTMLALNGYDERLSNGIAYGDDYLLKRVQMLGLNVEITSRPFVVHQWHYNSVGVPPQNVKNLLVNKNKKLYEYLLQFKEPRAKHIYTPDFENIVS